MPIDSLPKKTVAGGEQEQHASEHENGGNDEVNVGSLSGTLADPQTPEAHAPTHKAGNSDALSVADLANVLGVSEIKMDTAGNLTAGTANRLCVETDTGRVLYDNGTNFIEMGLSESQIALGNLASHTHADLSDAPADAHHTDPTAGTGIIDEGTNKFGQNVVLSGQVTLSSGVATIDTTLSATDATFMLALGIDDPNADCELAGRVFWDDSAGTYKIKILEQNTSIGNPTVNYDVVRVR